MSLPLATLSLLSLGLASAGDEPGKKEKKRLRLVGNEMVHAVSLFQMAERAYRSDPDWAIEILAAWVNDRILAQAILEGVISHEIVTEQGKKEPIILIDVDPDDLKLSLLLEEMEPRPGWIYTYRNLLLAVKNNGLSKGGDEERSEREERWVSSQERWADSALKKLAKTKTRFTSLLPDVQHLLTMLQTQGVELFYDPKNKEPDLETLRSVVMSGGIP